jgi:hypothetical protein
MSYQKPELEDGFFINEKGQLIIVDPEGTMILKGLVELTEPIYHTPELLWNCIPA